MALVAQHHVIGDYMVDNSTLPGNPGDPLELRTDGLAVRRLRDLLLARRCIVCLSPVNSGNPERLQVYGFSVCKRPECAAIILDAPLSELVDDPPGGDHDHDDE